MRRVSIDYIFEISIGYNYVQLHPTSRKLCTIVLLWDKYEYNILPMDLNNSPDIFPKIKWISYIQI